jgi:hypothetical protein
MWPNTAGFYVCRLGLRDGAFAGLPGNAAERAILMPKNQRISPALLAAGADERLQLLIGYDGYADWLWYAQSTDAGAAWTAWAKLQPAAYHPQVRLQGKEAFLLATRKATGEDTHPRWWKDAQDGDELLLHGDLLLWRWRPGASTPDTPSVAVSDRKVLWGSLAIREDGLLAITYVRQLDESDNTALWVTASRDGAHWSPPERATGEDRILYDLDTVFYRDELWLAYSRSESGMPPDLCIQRYHLPE